jgi:glycosyltransferase involved in cell wall biosynthesis
VVHAAIRDNLIIVDNVLFFEFDYRMDHNSDIIFFCLSRYDDTISFVGSSFAKELARKNRVFFIERPFTYSTSLAGNKEAGSKRAELWKKGGTGYLRGIDVPEKMHYIVPPQMLPVNFLPPGNMYNALSRWNDSKIFALLRRVIKENDIRSFIFINCFNPFYINEFPADIKPFMKVYYCVDDISQVAFTRKHGFRREERMISNYDACLVTGLELKRMKSSLNPKTYYLPNAVDFAHFNKAATAELKKPAELNGFSDKKLIGFTGSIEYRTDFELVKKMVEYHSDKVFVFVGPVLASDIKDLGIDAMPNVVFTGPRPVADLPSFLQYMDVLIIPYQLSVLTKSIYPLKLNEYLAAGKPVVSTNFSEDICLFSDVVHLAKDRDDFIRLIDVAIAENSELKTQQRIQRAGENTWTVRVEQFWAYMDEAASTYKKDEI